MFDRATNRIFALFSRADVPCYVVGGAVRDHILGLDAGDIDFAVAAPPDRVLELLERENIRAIKTGFDHGTITAIIGKRSFEITSFRRDVRTDGRHAVTEFGSDLTGDARRRDFTLNAIYMDASGALTDPVGGVGDLKAGILRFVGEAKRRIDEDRLRMLRFFRLIAQYGFEADKSALSAISDGAPNITRLSAERITSEMRKLLGGAHTRHALELTSQAGLLAHLLPKHDLHAFSRWREYCQAKGLDFDWRVELAALTSGSLPSLWALSRAEKRALEFLRETSLDNTPPHRIARKVLHQMPADDAKLLGEAALHLRGFSREPEMDAKADIAKFHQALREEFPINGDDLLPFIGAGPKLGALLDELYEEWARGDFHLGREELLALAKEKKQGSSRAG